MISIGRTIFSTVHGSHLYGLAHEDSDVDIFAVVEGERRRSYHRVEVIHGQTIDVVEVTLPTFLNRVQSGSHQSVEALFSQEKEWGMEEYRPLIENMRVTGSEVFAKYERTIKKFCFGDFKRRRHACRLALNLQELRASGRFDPKLTQMEALLCGEFAQHFEGQELFDMIIERASGAPFRSVLDS